MHVVYRFDVGGLENGVVNLINHMPASAFRHAVVSLTDVTSFRERVHAPGVDFIAFGKPPGHAVRLYAKMFRLFRRYRPAIVHTRNLAALEAVIPAWLAGVPIRIHGEHGRDMNELAGSRRRYNWVRRFYRPFVTHYVALSRDLADYLATSVGVPTHGMTRILNGVDATRFAPAGDAMQPIAGFPFDPRSHWVVGTIGRMQSVKDQTTLARAFVRAVSETPELRARLRLVMIGDGPLRAECRAILEQSGLADLAWMPGERQDVDSILRGLACFVLPSRGEGISNTILEAMASGLPVLATDVGGNAELVQRGGTGELVPAGDVQAMADALRRLACDPERAAALGRAGRLAVEERFSLESMIAAYRRLYESQIGLAAARGRH
jgi:sugar transferase (PEP-CTERM/EpsH1 system associated)